MIDTSWEQTSEFSIHKKAAVIVKSRGLIDVEYYDKPFTFKQEMWAYVGMDKILTKYLYYILKAKVKRLRDRGSMMGSMPQIKMSDTENLTIPVPPLKEQQRIVALLDKFDAITTDITSGLPAEVVARQKQYEYYRDKLLSF